MAMGGGKIVRSQVSKNKIFFFFFLMQLLETTLAFKEHVLGPKLIENKMEVSIHLSVYFLWHFYSIAVWGCFWHKISTLFYFISDGKKAMMEFAS